MDKTDIEEIMGILPITTQKTTDYFKKSSIIIIYDGNTLHKVTGDECSKILGSFKNTSAWVNALEYKEFDLSKLEIILHNISELFNGNIHYIKSKGVWID